MEMKAIMSIDSNIDSENSENQNPLDLPIARKDGREILIPGTKIDIANDLLKKSKQIASGIIFHDAFSGGTDITPEDIPNLVSTVLTDTLDVLLNPTLNLRNIDTLTWLRWIIASGSTPSDYKDLIQKHDHPTTCSLVWTADFMAYRCRTCGISACMSLCLECFKGGYHKGHDYNMFKSQAGGACDCGNGSVMKKEGFCSHHGMSGRGRVDPCPVHLTVVARLMMPRLLQRLIQFFRKLGDHKQSSQPPTELDEVEGFIGFLQEICNYGVPIREVMAETFCSKKLYTKHIRAKPDDGQNNSIFLTALAQNYEDCLKSIKVGKAPEKFADLAHFNDELKHETVIDEMVFWLIKFEFPQNLVCLLLNLRPEKVYEAALAKSFVLHYSRMAAMLINSKEREHLSNRVVHVSVQLFSHESLVCKVIDNYNLLHLMVLSLDMMFQEASQDSELNHSRDNKHQVANKEHVIMKKHVYWPLVSDMNNILTFKGVVRRFVSDGPLLHQWLQFISYFQGMYTNIRVPDHMDHIVHDDATHFYSSYGAELEACTSPIWAMLPSLLQPDMHHLFKKILLESMIVLKEWYKAIGIEHPSQLSKDEVCFHLPLHRIVGILMKEYVRTTGCLLHEVLPSPQDSFLFSSHPIRIQVAFYEIINNIWRRNGVGLKGQAVTYKQSNFCHSMGDPDLYLLQVITTQMKRDRYLLMLLDSYEASPRLNFSKSIADFNEEIDEKAFRYMYVPLKSFLYYLTLCASTNMLCANKEQFGLMELVNLVTCSDTTHSSLMEYMPDKTFGFGGVDYEIFLKSLTNFQEPDSQSIGSMKPGIYHPKAVVWEDLYDPIFYSQRMVHRREAYNGENRFKKFCKDTEKYREQTKCGGPWPPYRIPPAVSHQYVLDNPRHIFLCRTMHGIIFAYLYRCMQNTQLADKILPLTVHLLELTIEFQMEMMEKHKTDLVLSTGRNEDLRGLDQERPDMCYYSWFSTDDVFENATVVVDRIQLQQKKETQTVAQIDEGASTSDVQCVEMIDAEPARLAIEDTPMDESHRALVAGDELVPYNEDASALALRQDSLDESTTVVPRENIEEDINVSEMRAVEGNEAYPSLLSGSEVAVRGQHDVEPHISIPFRIEDSSERDINQYISPTGRSIENNNTNNSGEEGAVSLNEPNYLKLYPARRSEPQPVEVEEYLSVNDSIISLLIKHHFRMTEETAPYEPNFDLPEYDGRIGDGPFFISKVLNKLGAFSKPTADVIVKTVKTLFKKEETDEGGINEETDEVREDESEKKKRARRTREKVMAELAQQQKSFMKKQVDEEEKLLADANNSFKTKLTFEEDLLRAQSASDPPLAQSAEDPTQAQSAADPPQAQSSEDPSIAQAYDDSLISQASETPPQAQPCDDTPQGQSSEEPIEAPSSEAAAEEGQEPAETMEEQYDSDEFTPEQEIDMSCSICYDDEINKREPFSYICYISPTSLMGKRSTFPEKEAIPTKDNTVPYKTIHNFYTEKCGLLYKHFDLRYCFDVVNTHWNQNVRVDICGHVCHAKCLTEYISDFTRAYARGDTAYFYCPSCRKICNTMFPMANVYPSVFSENISLSVEKRIENEFIHISKPVNHELYAPQAKFLIKRLAVACLVDYENTKYSEPILMFYNSVFRMNVENDLIISGGTLINYRESPLLPYRCVLKPLRGFLSEQAKSSMSYVCGPDWICFLWNSLRQDTAVEAADIDLGIYNKMPYVPMLYRDPITLLIYFVLLLNDDLSEEYFDNIMRYLYHVLLVKTATQILDSISAYQREIACTSGPLAPIFKLTRWCLTNVGYYSINEEELMEDIDDPKRFIDTITCNFRETCVEFLRLAALIKWRLTDQKLPIILDPMVELGALERYFRLWNTSSTVNTASLDQMISGLSADYKRMYILANIWCEHLFEFSNLQSNASAILLSSHKFFQPTLLVLPQTFEELYSYYHKKKCNLCDTVPRSLGLCLVCGSAVCFEVACPTGPQINCGHVEHSMRCGNGRGIFLALQHASVFLVKESSVTFSNSHNSWKNGYWGCIHLDNFGDEDKDLKRGKPLYLSQHRYKLLENQWLNHTDILNVKKWRYQYDTS